MKITLVGGRQRHAEAPRQSHQQQRLAELDRLALEHHRQQHPTSSTELGAILARIEQRAQQAQTPEQQEAARREMRREYVKAMLGH